MWKKLLITGLILVAGAAAFVFYQLRALEVEQLSPDLHVLRGIGGNVTVLKTDAGAVVIDSMTTNLQGRQIRRKVQELTDSNTVLIINTHYHLDHTHGNPAFPSGTRVISTQRTLSHMKALDKDFWTGDAAALMPNETFSDQQILQIGGKSLQLFHPGRGHTDGDLVVVIENERVAVMGDLLFNNFYPNIDLEAGGSVQEWSASLDRVLQEKFDRVIPGHGATTDRLGINKFQRFIGQLARIGRAAEADNTDLATILQSTKLTADEGYQSIRFLGISLGLDREFVLRRAWEETTGNFERKN
jgi:glyoxylase-like metal-dependent hydrolase (beta-lactamase superfamily II)